MRKKEYSSLGIMSGTSLDGLDFSLIKTDGKNNVNIIANHYYKFNLKFKQNIKEQIKNINKSNYKLFLKTNNFQIFNKIFTELILEKILHFLDKNSININSLDAIGIHGNTIIHKPEIGISIQLGDALMLSKKLKIPVVSNFRENDIKENGQGAPLVPIFHKCIFSEAKNNIAVINLGGISNFSLLIGKNKVYASDIGPGNKLIDEFCLKNFGKDFDENGQFSSKGTVLEVLINQWKNKEFMNQPFPTSFDSSNFSIDDFVNDNLYNSFDIIRTLTKFSAFLIYNINEKTKFKIDKWILTGGGVKNPILLQEIKSLIGEKKVFTAEEFCFDSFFIESQAFAYIAIRTLKKLPSSFPSTTGCNVNTICGRVFTT